MENVLLLRASVHHLLYTGVWDFRFSLFLFNHWNFINPSGVWIPLWFQRPLFFLFIFELMIIVSGIQQFYPLGIKRQLIPAVMDRWSRTCKKKSLVVLGATSSHCETCLPLACLHHPSIAHFFCLHETGESGMTPSRAVLDIGTEVMRLRACHVTCTHNNPCFRPTLQ